MNHLTNFFVVDPTQRGYGQTPFNIGQCRRECPNFRAVEDRLPEIATFLAHQRPTDLYAARGLKDNQALVAQFDRELGKGSVALGQQVFADNCARCYNTTTINTRGIVRAGLVFNDYGELRCNKPLNSQHPNGINALFADGHVAFVTENIPLATLKLLVNRDDGDAVNYQ